MKIKMTINILKQVAGSSCAMLLCLALVAPGILICAQSSTQAPAQEAVTKIPPDQLDSLVAPVALYPDNLLAQVFVASTYPLELIQLHQWLQKNKDLMKPENQKKLSEKVQKQPWDPSIQAMAALPDVVKWLAEDIQWTTDLGNAFLAQQPDVMDAVQRMRVKAQQKGALKDSEQMKVQTQTVESKQVIVIEQSNPQVIYVPSYDPVYAYGPPVYPYPPVYYPPYPAGGYLAAGLIGFGVGVAVGAAWNGGWGWHCGWGGGDININRNNNFNRNTNISGGNRINTGGNTWQHNPQHRAGTPYADRQSANKYGGTARGDKSANRQQAAQRQLGQQGGNLGGGNRADTRDRAPGGDRGNISNRAPGGDRGNISNRDGAGDRGNISNRNGAGVSDRSRGSGSLGGSSSDRIGNRSVSGGSTGGRGFDGRSDGFSGSNARSSSSRGSSSMSSSRGSFGGSGGRGGFSGGRAGGGRRGR
jgi:hypothetical protein